MRGCRRCPPRGGATPIFARTTSVRGHHRGEGGIERVRDSLSPIFQEKGGCVGMSMLADLDTGRCIVTSAWAHESAMHASAEAMEESRRQAAEVMRADSVEVSEWRIALLHRMGPAEDGAATRGIWSNLTPGTADGRVNSFRMGALQ